MDSSFNKPWRRSCILFAWSLDPWYSRLLAFFVILSLRDSDCDHLISSSKPMKAVLFFKTFRSFSETLVKRVFKLFKSPFVLSILINLIWFIVAIQAFLPFVIIFRRNYIGLTKKVAEVTYFSFVFSEQIVLILIFEDTKIFGLTRWFEVTEIFCHSVLTYRYQRFTNAPVLINQRLLIRYWQKSLKSLVLRCVIGPLAFIYGFISPKILCPLSLFKRHERLLLLVIDSALETFGR